MKGARAITLSVLFFWCVNALALSTDRDQPATIEADEAQFNFRDGTRTYKGNVYIEQGTLRIKGDKLIAVFKNDRMETATVWGNPAQFKQRPDGKKHDVIGKGKKIVLNELKNTLTLYTKASLKQENDTALGETIVYQMDKDILTVKGGAKSKRAEGGDKGKPQKKGRARVVIMPAGDSKKKPKPTSAPKPESKAKPESKSEDSSGKSK